LFKTHFNRYSSVSIFLSLGVGLTGIFGCRTPQSTAQISPKSAYSFTQEPYISPLLVEELCTWISDWPDHAQVTALDLEECQNSNRFFGDFEVNNLPNQPPIVMSHKAIEGSERQEMFSYQCIGQTPNGIFVLWTHSNGGGTLTEQNLLLLEMVNELAYSQESNVARRDRPRTLLKRLGEINLEPSFKGIIRLVGQDLVLEYSQLSPTGIFGLSKKIHIE
jgi:hypothetical protein